MTMVAQKTTLITHSQYTVFYEFPIYTHEMSITQKNSPTRQCGGGVIGGPRGTRTFNTLIKSQLLYQLS